MKSKVDLRQMRIVYTPGVAEKLDDDQIIHLLDCHFNNNWGELVKEDKEANEDALEHGDRILSSYLVDGERIWIITDSGWADSDHKVTTVLLPDEY